MAKQKQAMITAQHLERTDKDGQPQVKQFTVKAWNDIPMQHFMSKEQGLVKNARQGWVQVGEATGKKAPEPLKSKAPEPVAEAPKAPAAPISRPAPFVEGQKV